MSTRKTPTKAAESRSAPRSAVKHRKIRSLLTRPLGLLGWERLEPVLLAALTTGDPLLLIGRHGTAKSFLLERLAQALGLVYRFYNASLINYDDLAGIPLPDETQTSLRYITTPTAIWDAEVVFVDELNRTRPDLQNKLFPIIHERRVQGVELEKLRYRWAAMNPAARQLAKKLVRGGVDGAKVILSWAPGDDAPFLIEASTTHAGVNLKMPRDELPPEEWFTINAIVRDLELQERDWAADLRGATSAKPLLPGSDEDRCNHEESDSIPRCSIPYCDPL
jgi:hypothetical protein